MGLTTEEVHLDSWEPVTVLRTWLTAPAPRMADAVRTTVETLVTAAGHASMRCAGPAEVAVLGPLRPCTQVEVRVPVTGSPAAGVLSSLWLRPGGAIARTLHDPGADDLATTCEVLLAWVADHGYQPTGPLTLVHLCTPEQALDPGAHLAEIAVPVTHEQGEQLCPTRCTSSNSNRALPCASA
ncbi:hypothetical protein LFM09_34300 [Lentzea alba]|uniref:hypothetical protein n=1 Tax=Lentzea alba TaxID=2714351 RepID=UPI0039BFD444